MKDASRLPHVNAVAERPEACVIMFGREGGKNSVPTVFFITHPDVAINPRVPVPEWPLNERGQVRMHNTLASSDYGLLDANTFTPRPNYWAALLWRKVMGTTVLDPGPSPAENLHLYAQCLRDVKGGVAILAINADRVASASLEVPLTAQRYTLTAQRLNDAKVRMNGRELRLGDHDALPALAGAPEKSDRVSFAPVSITFLAIPDAHNPACQ